MSTTRLGISVVIPTYRRGPVLLDTVAHLLALAPPPDEILLVDQTTDHSADTESGLQRLHDRGEVRWIRLPHPSIPRAMNVGLQQARSPVVLFLDDDIVPDQGLVAAHAAAQQEADIVAGQVLQPGESAVNPGARFRFNSDRRAWVQEFMGGNFSIKRDSAIRVGGFDENFVRVAYNFEAEFCSRARAAGYRILFEPAATLRHLKIASGGTRSYGEHLKTARPSHSVGAYYYLLTAVNLRGRSLKMLARLARSIRTRHHLRRPWWIPATLIAEVLGMAWAVRLHLRGPRRLDRQTRGGVE